MSERNTDRTLSAERLVTLVAVAVYVVWLLSLPAWPSQDGPVHLYYTHVLARLLGGTDTLYPRYFFIKHLVPPYALYYYILLLLSRVVSLLLADKLVICAYLLLFVSGFHALARAIVPPGSRGPDRATLLATLLLLNWPLGMGFVNYCLSLALGLWALALWFCFSNRTALPQRALFLLLVIAVTLAHPVPLLIVLGIGAADLLTRGFRARNAAIPRRRDALTLVLAALPLLYVRAFATSHLLAQRTAVDVSPLRHAQQHYAAYLQGRTVSLLFGSTPAVEIYRIALVLTLLLALAAAAPQAARNLLQRRVSLPDLFLYASVALLVVLPWLPSDLSGAYFFPERLVLPLWIFALLAAAGWAPPDAHAAATPDHRPPLLTSLLLLFVCTATAALLLAADRALRHPASQALLWQATPLVQRGDVVLSLESAQPPTPPPSAPSWNPYYWMAVHPLRAHDAILANAPWLDSSIIPLAAQPILPARGLQPQIANAPGALTGQLRQTPALAVDLFRAVNVVSFSPAMALPAGSRDPLLTGPVSPAAHWICQTTPDGGDQICRASP